MLYVTVYSDSPCAWHDYSKAEVSKELKGDNVLLVLREAWFTNHTPHVPVVDELDGCWVYEFKFSNGTILRWYYTNFRGNKLPCVWVHNS